MKHKIFVADLSHTSDANIAVTFPLGAAFVASYAQKWLSDVCEFRLFKFPEPMASAILQEHPSVVAFSNYQWNIGLTDELCRWVKRKDPSIVSVFGGPNFPVAQDEKVDFLSSRPALDFYIEFEGEVGFTRLVQALLQNGFDATGLKARRDRISNCTYLTEGGVVEGASERIKDLNEIPSPYLTGLMDPFFETRLVPMIETTRGCPFSCTFCADGMAFKSRIFRVDSSRTKAELEYISARVDGVHQLIVTDLNFGMYEQDVETALAIEDIRSRHNWPLTIQATAGKNKPDRILKVAGLLKGAWVTGSAIQSSDPDVLQNVRRSNISLDTYKRFTQNANCLDPDSMSYTELILGLPGDTKRKHFQSLRDSIESGVRTLYMYQAIMLIGTEMAARDSREKHGLITKFRAVPGGWGLYQLGDEEVPTLEIEEIVIGSKTMPVADYVSCRVMHLLVEFFYNNGLCEELFAALVSMRVPVFDFLEFLHEREELYTDAIKDVIDSFRRNVTSNLYASYDEAKSMMVSSGLLRKYMAGELGAKGLMSHKARLYANIGEAMDVCVKAMKVFLAERGMVDSAVTQYLDEAKELLLCRKAAIHDLSLNPVRDFWYDFEAIERLGYAVDPRAVRPAARPMTFRFSHDDGQREHIRMALAVYGGHIGGIARAIKRLNLKKLNRRLERVGAVTPDPNDVSGDGAQSAVSS